MAEAFGVGVGGLPAGWIPTKVISVVECFDPDSTEDGPGALRLSVRASDDLSLWTAIGMLRSALADLDQQYLGTLPEM